MGNTHSVLIGYLTWIFGFTGAHRFYLGKVGTGMIELSLAILVPWTFGLAAIPLALFQLYDLWIMNEQISEVNRRIAYTRQPVRTC